MESERDATVNVYDEALIFTEKHFETGKKAKICY